MAELPPPPEGIVLTHFIVSDDVERSRRFYTEVLGGRLVFSGPGGLTYVGLANSWIIINVGGGPTDDKPAVTLETPRDPDGYIIEVGQTTDPGGDWSPAHWPSSAPADESE
jgi:catechol 2,3-dioxygenase-like lactoylglutathione lyase family enzyme